MFEAACELQTTCNVDQLSMKAYLSRWLATSSVVAPWIAGKVGILLRASAIGAASACTAGPFSNTCGSKWYINGSDHLEGLGQQLSALEVMTGLLANGTSGPRHLSQVTISYPTSFPTSIAAASQPSSTAPPLHDSPPNSAFSKRDTAKYGGLLMGLIHFLL